MDDLEQEEQRECLKCGDEIPPARLKAVPLTKYCVNCVPKYSPGNKKKFIKDSFGSRKEYKRDRKSWGSKRPFG